MLEIYQIPMKFLIISTKIVINNIATLSQAPADQRSKE